MALSDYTPVLAWFADSLTDLDLPTGATKSNPTGLSDPPLSTDATASDPDDSFAEYIDLDDAVSYALPSTVNGVGTGDITVVAKLQWRTTASGRVVIETESGGWEIYNHSGSSRRVGFRAATGTQAIVCASNILSASQDFIVAFRRSSGTWTLWIDVDATGGMSQDTPSQNDLSGTLNLSAIDSITFGSNADATNPF